MAKRNAQLVSQHLEGISRRMLEERPEIIRGFVRRRHGVYALYRGNKLYYAGLTGGLLGRLRSHLKDRHGHTWDKFSVYLTVNADYMKEIESVLIRIADPPGNKQRGKFIRSENLLNKVRAEFRRRRKEDEEAMGLRPGSGGRAPKAKAARPKKRNAKTTLVDENIKRLRARYKRKTYWARVLKDGKISHGGKRYNSLSAAATAITKQPTNGWLFWNYERAPGEWLRLKALRR
ncbi:hypothetical protein LCGC14_0017160 [marine sediment metagenome]|uniref:RAMA domain-containing protein n=1 Tax=marine sediment metagenome TaxID=412755 RepID=A0A0F9W4F3_9ZZZZ|nr:DUF2924 domain-containing protein [Phycisphaerae bacterium]HDZ42422.1 DUF2924 domain-containing protein [Phycisphaerae bacterium]